MKHFEEEYRKYMNENTPDLWDRIEAGLTEKTDREEQTPARRVPDNWQVIESRLEDRPAGRDDIRYNKPNKRRYLQGILTAAAGFFIIATAAITLNMRQKSADVAQNLTSTYPKEEAAYESQARESPAAAMNADAVPEALGTTEGIDSSNGVEAQYEPMEEIAAEYDSMDEAEAEYSSAYEGEAEYSAAYEINAEDNAAAETASEYGLTEEASETAKDIEEESDRIDSIMAFDSDANGASGEETAADRGENMIESETGEYYEEESAGEEMMDALPTLTFATIEELGISLTLPLGLTERPLTTEEQDQGYICEYTGTATGGITPTLTARYINTEAETLDEYAEILAEEGITATREYATGIRTNVLEYTRKDQNRRCILYFAENGTPVELSITPESTELLRSISRYSAD